MVQLLLSSNRNKDNAHKQNVNVVCKIILANIHVNHETISFSVCIYGRVFLCI